MPPVGAVNQPLNRWPVCDGAGGSVMVSPGRNVPSVTVVPPCSS